MRQRGLDKSHKNKLADLAYLLGRSLVKTGDGKKRQDLQDMRSARKHDAMHGQSSSFDQNIFFPLG